MAHDSNYNDHLSHYFYCCIQSQVLSRLLVFTETANSQTSGNISKMIRNRYRYSRRL